MSAAVANRVIYVSMAQVMAARAIVQRSAARGRTVREAVRKIAEVRL